MLRGKLRSADRIRRLPQQLVNISGSSEIVDVVLASSFLFPPKGEVLLKEFNDGLSIAEVVFFKLVNLVEGLLEGVVGKGASLRVVLHDFVVEDREVEGETQLDRVASGKLDGVGLVVGNERALLHFLKLGTLCVLGDVAVVVADHLDEESLGLTIAGLGKHLVLNDVDDAVAVTNQLLLDLVLVGGESFSELGVLRVLLDSGNGAASGALGRDQVLESDGDEVALIGRDVSALDVEDGLEVGNHVVEALGLLGDASEEDVLVNGRSVGHRFLLCF
jgi:hypothetical protein